ncbi:hypothetical protein Bca101_057046 [Brassica carinata]
MEEMRVSRAVKMLRKKTVTDPHIRIKLALLALVSSVLLSTNLKQKMLKEHAELLEDTDAFLSFPWGHLAFDMLMTSIKKRDEISLSQNTIALQGFALALQLVIVEAVPALTEVVQDACSSSESDSEDEDTEIVISKAKKKTLNPAHARELDRKAEVVVRSIIPEDPQRPLMDAVLVWTDEVFDIKVEHLVNLIRKEFVFRKDMFKGGATKEDVEKMRESSKVVGKRKQTRQKEIQNVEGDVEKIASVVLALLKPELKRIDGNVSAGLSSMKELASSSLQYKDDVLATVSGMIKEMKSEIIGTFTTPNADAPSHGHNNTQYSGNVSNQIPSKQPTVHVEAGIGVVGSADQCMNPATGNVSIPGSSFQPTGVADDENHKTIENVLENLSHYSTPPGSPNDVNDRGGDNMHPLTPISGTDSKARIDAVSNIGLSTNPQASPHSQRINQVIAGYLHSGTVSNKLSKLPLFNESPGPHAGDSKHEFSTLSGHSETHDPRRSDEKNELPPCEDDKMGENENVLGLETHNDTHLARKSKRMRTVPPYLLTGYHCGSDILNRAREGQLWGATHYEMSVIREKYARLSTIIKKPCVINVAGLSVTHKDLLDIAERNRLLPGKVVDILMRLVRSTFDNQVLGKVDISSAFLDSRFASLLCRNHPKFQKEKNKAAFLFSKSLVDAVMNSCESFTPATRFYLPFFIGKKHWIGICLDFTAAKLYVLDCNAGLNADTALRKDLLPISEMFPLLLKQCGVSVAGVDTPLVVERIESLPQNQNAGDAGITTFLLIQRHAIFGTEHCLRISPSVIADEAHRAAVMIYEFHVKL